MANPVLVHADWSVDRGGKFVLTATQLDGTDADSNLSHFLCTVLPTHGTLKLNGVAVTLTTHITQADITAGKLVYFHDGTANSDAATFKAVDLTAGESAPSAETITMVANGGWMALAKPFGAPAIVIANVNTEVVALGLIAEWLAAHSGAAEAVKLAGATAVTVITRDSYATVADALDSPYAKKKADVVLEIQRRLLPIITDTANADLKALLNAHGGLMATQGKVAMVPSVQRRWDAIVVAIDSAHLRRRWVEIDDLGGALEELKGTLA